MDIATLDRPSSDRYPWKKRDLIDDPIVVCTETSLSYPLLDMIEFSEHKVDIDEDNGEAKDQVGDISPDGAGGNVPKAVGHVHLHSRIDGLKISRFQQKLGHLLFEHVRIGINL